MSQYSETSGGVTEMSEKLEFTDMLDRFCRAVESEDSAALGALFTEDGIYHDGLYGAVKGPDAIKEMLDDLWYKDGEDYRWDMLDPVCDGETGYARYDCSFKSKMKHSLGKRLAVKGVATFKLAPDGRVIRYTEIANGAAMLHQLNVRGELLEKVVKDWSDSQNKSPAMQRHLAD